MPASLPPRHLGSTYRLQLRPGDLASAARLLPYLAGLGVETLYLSPLSTARPGSTHGYDVSDPTTVDPALGGWPAWLALLDQAELAGLGVLIDVVPNHLAASEHSPWWAELLRHGRRGPAGAVFDVDWAVHGDRVLVPVLGAPFDEVVTSGELQVATAAAEGEPAGIVPGEAVVRYGPRCFPLDPGSWAHLAADPGELGRQVAGRRGRPASWEALRALLDAQHFRLAWWRTSATDGNYRRFFDIDDLAGVRMEDPAVRGPALDLVLAMAADRRVAGVRIDHIDGLADPAGFLAHLRRHLGVDPGTTGGTEGEPVDGTPPRPVVLVEKILARGEPLPDWPVDGTTGYELADLAVGVLVHSDGARQLAEGAAGGAGDADALARAGRHLALDLLFPGPHRRVVSALTEVARAVPGHHDLTVGDVDWALTELTAAMTVYRPYTAPASTPASAADRDALAVAVQRAVEGRRPVPDPATAPSANADPARLLRDVADLLLLERVDRVPTPVADRWRLTVSRWQQLASAVAAKGVEDTALYRFDGSLAQADVGAEPAEPAVGPDAFHRAMVDRQARWPGSLNATSTHDSKRSEDVRARLAAATELGATLPRAMTRWHLRHRSLVATTGGGPSPDPLEERQLYQTMLGVWPFEPLAPTPHRHPHRRVLLERLQAYAEKAGREAKLRTSWTSPDEAHERAVRRFLGRLLTSPAGDRFVADLDRLTAVLGPAGAVNSLALLAVKATAPGVPDVYQGCESWAFTLVDPDNRTPVDLDAAEARWAATVDAPLDELVRTWPDGRLKLRLTADLLQLRRHRPDLFGRGRYLPVAVRGPAARHVLAFARHRGRRWALTVVPRHTAPWRSAGTGRPGKERTYRPAALVVDRQRWAGTSLVLPDGAPTGWQLAGGHGEVGAARRRLAVGDVLARLPVAVLTADA